MSGPALSVPPGGFPAYGSPAYEANAQPLAKAFDMHFYRFPGFDAPPEALEGWRTQYTALVAVAKSVLGPEAHCNHVDPDLWEAYSDCYKSDNGFRPRGHVTAAEAAAWFAARRESEAVPS